MTGLPAFFNFALPFLAYCVGKSPYTVHGATPLSLTSSRWTVVMNPTAPLYPYTGTLLTSYTSNRDSGVVSLKDWLGPTPPPPWPCRYGIRRWGEGAWMTGRGHLIFLSHETVGGERGSRTMCRSVHSIYGNLALDQLHPCLRMIYSKVNSQPVVSNEAKVALLNPGMYMCTPCSSRRLLLDLSSRQRCR